MEKSVEKNNKKQRQRKRVRFLIILYMFFRVVVYGLRLATLLPTKPPSQPQHSAPDVQHNH